MIAATRVVRMLDGAHHPAGGRPGFVLRGRPERVGGCHRYGISFLILHGGCSLRAPPRSSARSSALSAMRSRRQQRRQPREANEIERASPCKGRGRPRAVTRFLAVRSRRLHGRYANRVVRRCRQPRGNGAPPCGTRTFGHKSMNLPTVLFQVNGSRSPKFRGCRAFFEGKPFLHAR